MKVATFNKRFFDFLSLSSSPYHVVNALASILENAGFNRVKEDDSIRSSGTKPNFLIREDGSIIAWNKSAAEPEGFRIVGSHSDSPALKLKPKPDVYKDNIHQLGVEVYGGALLNPWFDRELSLAGRVTFISSSGEVLSRLVDFNREIAYIPSLAIHFDRNGNTDKSVNAQKDITPLAAIINNHNQPFTTHLTSLIEKSYTSKVKEILDFDLFFYDCSPARYSGFNKEFITAGKLDNQLSCFVAIQALLRANKQSNFVFICNNHEEIGSTSASGAQGNLLQSFFERIEPDPDKRYRLLANSFFISIDNAHATHPNFSDKHEPSHKIALNGGPVIKINANQRYASTSLSTSVFKILCRETHVPFQEFVMRNDLACGSTIGPFTAAKLGLKTVDVGAASLGMHSVRELTGSDDPFMLFSVISHFLSRKKLPQVLS